MMNNFGSEQLFGLGLMSIAGLSLIAGAVFLAVLALKGYALWTAAKRDEKWWFIILLVVNTVGILELIYLYFVAKKWNKIDENKVYSNNSGITNTVNSSTNTNDIESKKASNDNQTS